MRATLDASFAVLIAALSGVAILVLLSGIEVSLSRPLLGLAVGAAVANGLFDYNTALVRARFMDGLYARIIMGKNLLSLVLTVGGAWWFGSAAMALTGVCLSMTGSLLASRRSLTDAGSSPRAARRGLAAQALRYALPIVMANMLYQVIPLVDRALIAQRYGFAESGQFSLAYDLGIRIVLAIGSTLDVLLFQLAVRTDETHGADQSRRQIGRNMGVVVAVLAPTCMGRVAGPAVVPAARRAAGVPRALRAVLHLPAARLLLLPADPLRDPPGVPDPQAHEAAHRHGVARRRLPTWA